MTVSQPHNQLSSDIQRSGARYLQVKYRPPDVGYADTSSATDVAMHMQPMPAMSQDHTADAGPPAERG